MICSSEKNTFKTNGTYDPCTFLFDTPLSDNSEKTVVKIKQRADQFSQKTYPGLYLGDITAMSGMVNYKKDTRELVFSGGYHNPAIFVFELKRIFLDMKTGVV